MPKDSPVKTIADLKGKRVASGPGIQNVTLAKTMLERAGRRRHGVIELPIGQHVAAIAAGQVDAVLHARADRHRRPPERHHARARSRRGRQVHPRRPAGAVARRLGAASRPSSSRSIRPRRRSTSPPTRKGIELVRTKPDEARQYLKGYTAIEGALTAEVPLAVVHALQRVQAERRRLLPEVLRPVLRQGHLREARRWSSRCSTRGEPWPTATSTAIAAPWSRARDAAAGRRRSASDWARLLPVVGPLLLFVVWDLVVRFGLHQGDPAADAGGDARHARHAAWPAGRCCTDFARDGEAHAAGVPDRRGDRRAARRAARQQRARLPQRRVPDRLLPLDAVVGADPAVPADLRRLRHQQGRDRRLRRVADRALQQRLRRDQRAQAARHGGAR